MSYVGKAGAAFIPQVYRNTRIATRKRRAAPQLASTVITQVMSYVPEECPFITNNAERCGASFRYRNQLNQQRMDCSRYCVQNVGVWLSSLLEDLAQKEYISFVVPLPSGVPGTSLDREYNTEYILHPIRFFASTSAPREYLHDIELWEDTSAEEIEEYVTDIQLAAGPFETRLSITIPVQLSENRAYESENDEEKQEEETLDSVIGSNHIVSVEITDDLFATSMLRHFNWSGSFESFSDSPFYLEGYLDVPLR